MSYVFSQWKCADVGKRSYLAEIRNIAVNRRSISSGVLARMKRSAILLGARRVRKGKTGISSPTNELDEDEECDFEYDLMKPDTIVVVDDTNIYQHFGDVIFAAPQEDLLEGKIPSHYHWLSD